MYLFTHNHLLKETFNEKSFFFNMNKLKTISNFYNFTYPSNHLSILTTFIID